MMAQFVLFNKYDEELEKESFIFNIIRWFLLLKLV
jgi:hypothetical protein